MKQPYRFRRKKFLNILKSTMGLNNPNTYSDESIINNVKNLLIQFELNEKFIVDNAEYSGSKDGHISFDLVAFNETSNQEFIQNIKQFESIITINTPDAISHYNAEEIILHLNQLMSKHHKTNLKVVCGFDPDIESAIKIKYGVPNEFKFFGVSKMNSDIVRALFKYCKEINIEIKTGRYFGNTANFFVFVETR
jgi:hypothetical protein